jgi:integrase/recombinase XerC
MLEGWTAQQIARYFKPKTVKANLQAARSFAAFTGRWPWQWHAEDVDAYLGALLGPPRGLRPVTVRGYQARLRGLVSYLADERYPWMAICRQEFGRAPVQLFDDRYGLAHLTGFEGDPRRRPLTVDELEAFFACCDARITRRRGLGRKGELSAWRDQAVFKVMFAWGLRRAETASLDVVDFRGHAALPEFREFAALHVRYGKSMPGGPAAAADGADGVRLGRRRRRAVPGRGAPGAATRGCAGGVRDRARDADGAGVDHRPLRRAAR